MTKDWNTLIEKCGKNLRKIRFEKNGDKIVQIRGGDTIIDGRKSKVKDVKFIGKSVFELLEQMI